MKLERRNSSGNFPLMVLFSLYNEDIRFVTFLRSEQFARNKCFAKDSHRGKGPLDAVKHN